MATVQVHRAIVLSSSRPVKERVYQRPNNFTEVRIPLVTLADVTRAIGKGTSEWCQWNTNVYNDMPDK